jgi:hypothetical protein
MMSLDFRVALECFLGIAAVGTHVRMLKHACVCVLLALARCYLQAAWCICHAEASTESWRLPCCCDSRQFHNAVVAVHP